MESKENDDTNALEAVEEAPKDKDLGRQLREDLEKKGKDSPISQTECVPRTLLRGAESFFGAVETVEDASLIVEACRLDLLPRVTCRLGDEERALIRAGSSFVFKEDESGIKRWTDGKIWSPSRIAGEFLLYRQLEQRQAPQKRPLSGMISALGLKRIASNNEEPTGANDEETSGDKSTGHLYKKDGLVKKTLSFAILGEIYHFVSYYRDRDLYRPELLTPSRHPFFAAIRHSRPVSETVVRNMNATSVIELDSKYHSRSPQLIFSKGSNHQHPVVSKAPRLFGPLPLSSSSSSPSSSSPPLPSSPLYHRHRMVNNSSITTVYPAIQPTYKSRLPYAPLRAFGGNRMISLRRGEDALPASKSFSQHHQHALSAKPSNKHPMAPKTSFSAQGCDLLNHQHQRTSQNAISISALAPPLAKSNENYRLPPLQRENLDAIQIRLPIPHSFNAYNPPQDHSTLSATTPPPSSSAASMMRLSRLIQLDVGLGAGKKASISTTAADDSLLLQHFVETVTSERTHRKHEAHLNLPQYGRG